MNTDERMDRRAILTRDIVKDMLGIEVGPWFSPLVPKAEGYRSLVLDVFDQSQLLERAKRDNAIEREAYKRIEAVDFVGGATDLASMVQARHLSGQIDYIVSSHNFEHLPNPVLFLQGCEKALKPGGLISMAIPDRRGCFDYFRPVSTTADFLESFRANRNRPSAACLFENRSLAAKNTINGQAVTAWYHDRDGSTAYPDADILAQYEDFLALKNEEDGEYRDAHCSVFTRASFELIIRDLQYLGLINLGVSEMGGPVGCEFFTKLVKGLPTPDKAEFTRRRAELLHDIIDESGSNSRMVERSIAEQDVARRALDLEIASLQSQRDALEARLTRIYATFSWRLTSFLRKSYGALVGKPQNEP